MMFTIGMDKVEEVAVAQNELFRNAAFDVEEHEVVLKGFDSDIEKMFKSDLTVREDLEKKLQQFDVQISMIPKRMLPNMFNHWHGKSKAFWHRFFLLRLPVAVFNVDNTLNSSGNSFTPPTKSPSVSIAANPLPQISMPSPSAGIVAKASTSKAIEKLCMTSDEVNFYNSLNGTGWIRTMKAQADKKRIEAPLNASPLVNNYLNANHVIDEENFIQNGKLDKLNEDRIYECELKRQFAVNHIKEILNHRKNFKKSGFTLEEFEVEFEETVVYDDAKSFFDDNFSSVSQQFENSQTVNSKPFDNNLFFQNFLENRKLSIYPSLMDPDEDTPPAEIRQENMANMRLQRVNNYFNSQKQNPPSKVSSFVASEIPNCSPSAMDCNTPLISFDDDVNTVVNTIDVNNSSKIPSKVGNLKSLKERFALEISAIIRHQIKTRFDQLEPFKNETDLEALKMLISVIAQTAKQLWKNDDDNLHAEVIDMALERIPRNLMSFFQMCNVNKMRQAKPGSLMQLLQYLCGQLSYYKANIHKRWRQQLEQSKLEGSKDGNGYFKYSKDTCKYCKSVGHYCDDCPDIARILCFNCYQFGHTFKRCRNAPLFD